MVIVNHTPNVRRAVATALNGGGTGVASPRIYGEGIPAKPDYPFVSVGVIVDADNSGWCADGVTGSFAVSVYANGPDASEAYDIGFAVKSDLHKKPLALPGGGGIHSLKYTSATVVQGDEKGKWRNIIQFEFATSE